MDRAHRTGKADGGADIEFGAAAPDLGSFSPPLQPETDGETGIMRSQLQGFGHDPL